MTRNGSIWLIGGLLLCGAALPARAWYEKGGATGPGARAMGMAGAYTALAADESAVWWNPAGMGEADSLRLGSSWQSLYNGSRQAMQLSAVYPLPSRSAAGINWMHEFYTQAAAAQTDLVNFAGSLPLSPDGRMRLGAGFKFLFGGVENTGRGFLGLGLDAGVRYKLPLNDGNQELDLALRLQDLDTRLQWDNGQSESVPQSLVLGVGYHVDRETSAEMDVETVQAADAASESVQILRLGIEHVFQENFSIRGGYLLENRRNSAFSLGAGWKYSDWDLQYAWLSSMEFLGASHRLSLTYGFPALRLLKPGQPPEAKPLKSPLPEALALAFDLLPLPSVFSPNGDGVADLCALQIQWKAGEASKTAGWELAVKNSRNEVIFSQTGNGFPADLIWEGKDRQGAVQADGAYTAELRLLDADGRTAGEASAGVMIRTQAPKLELIAEPAEVTVLDKQPEGPVAFRLQGDIPAGDVAWQMILAGPRGRIVKRFQGNKRLPAFWEWDGRTAGRFAAAGPYSATLSVTDSAGLVREARAEWRVVAAESALQWSVAPELIRPGDPKQGSAVFSVRVEPAGKVRSWRLTIQDAVGKQIVRVLQNKGPVPKQVVWNGESRGGKRCEDGQYLQAQLQVVFQGGAERTAPTLYLGTDLRSQETGQSLALHLTAVFFDSDSEKISKPGLRQLQSAIETIRRYAKNYRLQVKGYTDDQEAPGRRLELSWKRARAVKDVLVNSGRLPETRMEAVGYGDSLPLADNKTSSGPSRNRRVEVVLIIQK